jgi:hypothetical protein
MVKLKTPELGSEQLAGQVPVTTVAPDNQSTVCA